MAFKKRFSNLMTTLSPTKSSTTTAATATPSSSTSSPLPTYHHQKLVNDDDDDDNAADHGGGNKKKNNNSRNKARKGTKRRETRRGGVTTSPNATTTMTPTSATGGGAAAAVISNGSDNKSNNRPSPTSSTTSNLDLFHPLALGGGGGGGIVLTSSHIGPKNVPKNGSTHTNNNKQKKKKAKNKNSNNHSHHQQRKKKMENMSGRIVEVPIHQDHNGDVSMGFDDEIEEAMLMQMMMTQEFGNNDNDDNDQQKIMKTKSDSPVITTTTTPTKPSTTKQFPSSDNDDDVEFEIVFEDTTNPFVVDSPAGASMTTTNKKEMSLDNDDFDQNDIFRFPSLTASPSCVTDFDVFEQKQQQQMAVVPATSATQRLSTEEEEDEVEIEFYHHHYEDDFFDGIDGDIGGFNDVGFDVSGDKLFSSFHLDDGINDNFLELFPPPTTTYATQPKSTSASSLASPSSLAQVVHGNDAAHNVDDNGVKRNLFPSEDNKQVVIANCGKTAADLTSSSPSPSTTTSKYESLDMAVTTTNPTMKKSKTRVTVTADTSCRPKDAVDRENDPVEVGADDAATKLLSCAPTPLRGGQIKSCSTIITNADNNDDGDNDNGDQTNNNNTDYDKSFSSSDEQVLGGQDMDNNEDEIGGHHQEQVGIGLERPIESNRRKKDTSMTICIDQYGTATFSKVVADLTNNSHIRELHIFRSWYSSNGCKRSAKDLLLLFNAVRSMTSLQVLKLANFRGSELDDMMTSNNVNRNSGNQYPQQDDLPVTHLQLHICHGSISQSTLEQLARMPFLHELVMEMNESFPFHHVLSSRTLSKLVVLANNYDMGNMHMMETVEMLRKNQSLKSLIIEPPMRLRAFKLLAYSLQSNTTLEELNVSLLPSSTSSSSPPTADMNRPTILRGRGLPARSSTTTVTASRKEKSSKGVTFASSEVSSGMVAVGDETSAAFEVAEMLRCNKTLKCLRNLNPSLMIVGQDGKSDVFNALEKNTTITDFVLFNERDNDAAEDDEDGNRSSSNQLFTTAKNEILRRNKSIMSSRRTGIFPTTLLSSIFGCSTDGTTTKILPTGTGCEEHVMSFTSATQRPDEILDSMYRDYSEIGTAFVGEGQKAWAGLSSVFHSVYNQVVLSKSS